MRAIVFDGQVRFRDDYPDPTPPPGEALVRVTAAGLCNTDLEIAKGYMGFTGVLGHEFVGVVEHAPDPTWVGRRVVGEINCSCGSCGACHAGMTGHCPNRTVLGILGRGGAFADRLCLPMENLHEVPEQVADEQAVFVEPLAAAFEILEQVSLGPDDRVAVLGDGKLGLLVAQALATTGCDLVAIGRHPDKLAHLEARGIATATADQLPAGRFDAVAECTGRAEGFEAALGLVRPRGTLVLKSTVAAGVPLNLAPVVIDEITIIGSRCGPFPRAIEALQRGEVSVREFVTATYPIAQAADAFDRARDRGAIKVLIDMTA